MSKRFFQEKYFVLSTSAERQQENVNTLLYCFVDEIDKLQSLAKCDEVQIIVAFSLAPCIPFSSPAPVSPVMLVLPHQVS